MSQFSPNMNVMPGVPADMRVAVVSTQWNAEITDALAQGCVDRLIAAGVKPEDVQTFQVPGAIELTFAASKLIETSLFDVVVVIGCVIRGATPHFDYVCQSVTQGITMLNQDCDTPTIFGILTVDNLEQAHQRLSKGAEYADTAIHMVAFNRMTSEM